MNGNKKKQLERRGIPPPLPFLQYTHVFYFAICKVDIQYILNYNLSTRLSYMSQNKTKENPSLYLGFNTFVLFM